MWKWIWKFSKTFLVAKIKIILAFCVSDFIFSQPKLENNLGGDERMSKIIAEV